MSNIQVLLTQPLKLKHERLIVAFDVPQTQIGNSLVNSMMNTLEVTTDYLVHIGKDKTSASVFVFDNNRQVEGIYTFIM